MIPLAFILIVILQAASDALFFVGMKDWSKLVECLYIVLFFIPVKSAFWRSWGTVWCIGLFYLFIRCGIYDLVFNLIAGLNVNYVGNTSFGYDWLMSKLSDWVFWVFRIAYLSLAGILYVKVLKYEKLD